jgi:hypothetical protein
MQFEWCSGVGALCWLFAGNSTIDLAFGLACPPSPALQSNPGSTEQKNMLDAVPIPMGNLGGTTAPSFLESSCASAISESASESRRENPTRSILNLNVCKQSKNENRGKVFPTTSGWSCHCKVYRKGNLFYNWE